MSTRPHLGQIGIWSMELRFGDPAAIAEAAAEVDDLGFGAIWVPGGIGGDVAGDVNRLLAATKRTTIATGIINIWKHTPAEIAGWWDSLPDNHRSRLLLGLGISHGPIIGEDWASRSPARAPGSKNCWPLAFPRRTCALPRSARRWWRSRAN